MKMYLAAFLLHSSLQYAWGDLMDSGFFRGMTRELALLRKEKHEQEKVSRARKLSSSPYPTSPSQKFFIPFEELELLQKGFKRVLDGAKDPVSSFISMAVSVDNTIIWYDHHEDGYESDIESPGLSTTQVWGDNNKANGCAPGVDPCTDDADVLLAGSAIIAESKVNTTKKNQIYFDGGDKIYASLPIAITRGAYPQYPGSALAGAVEVLDTSVWGTSYTIPLDDNSPSDTGAFEITGYFIMAEEDGTSVTLPDGAVVTLDEGESYVIHEVTIGEKIQSDKPIQVHIITGDKGSYYEMRWFSLLPVETWSNEYLSPVGDDFAKVFTVLYNPNDVDIKVKYSYRDSTDNNIKTKVTKVPAGKNGKTDIIPTGSGCRLWSKNEEDFVAFVMIDNLNDPNTKNNTKGQVHDWGFPATPIDMLTPSVLVGWGYGCEDNDCMESGETRSPVWVTPVEDADIYCDYDGDGVHDDKQSVNFLNRAIFADDEDKDLSGAFIWATKPGKGDEPVKIAAAWGQNPLASDNNDKVALDLGTVIPPLPSIDASKNCVLFEDNPDDKGDCKGEITVGDTITYTIFLTATGQLDLPEGSLTITDELDPNCEYLADTTKYLYTKDGVDHVIDIEDDDTGTIFPLDDDGIQSQALLEKRGGEQHRIQFLCEISDMMYSMFLTNTGTFKSTGSLIEEVHFSHQCMIEQCDDSVTSFQPTPGPRVVCPEEEY